jgi:hypothetical protein
MTQRSWKKFWASDALRSKNSHRLLRIRSEISQLHNFTISLLHNFTIVGVESLGKEWAIAEYIGYLMEDELSKCGTALLATFQL